MREQQLAPAFLTRAPRPSVPLKHLQFLRGTSFALSVHLFWRPIPSGLTRQTTLLLYQSSV